MLGGLVALLALGSPASASGPCGDDDGCVIVTVMGRISTARTFGAGELDAMHDIVRQSYALRPAGGSQTVTGTSLRAMVAAIDNPAGSGQLSPDDVAYVEVFDPAGRAHRLERGELGEPGANGFVDGLSPAVFSDGDPARLWYIRPLRSGTDQNTASGSGLGFFSSGDNGALRITVHVSRIPIGVQVRASTTEPQISEEVALSARLDDGSPTDLVYDWDFGDGSPRSDEASPSHTWTSGGSYLVRLGVSSAAGDAVGTASIRIAVGPQPTPSPTPPGGGATPDPALPSAGPTSGGGHQQGGPPKPRPTAGPGSPTSGSAPQAAGGPAATPSASPTATSSETPTAPASESAGATPSASGRTVMGVLIAADAVTVVPSAAADERSAPAARSGRSVRRLGVVAGAVATTVLLMVLGAVAEARSTWRPRRSSGRR